jgi:hypothetical protein
MVLFQRSHLIRVLASSLFKVLGAISVAGIVVWFSSARINAITASIVQQRKIAAISSHRAEATAKLRADFKTVENSGSALQSALISPEDSLLYLAYLESIAAQSTMTQKVRFGSPIPYSGVKLPISTLEYTIELSGTHQTLQKYLSLLETGRYYSSITSLALNSSTDSGWDGVSNIVLSGKLYVSE